MTDVAPKAGNRTVRRLPNAAYRHRQAKPQYPRWSATPSAQFWLLPTSICALPCTSGVGEPRPFGFINRPIEGRNIECRFSSVTTMLTKPSRY